MWCNDVYNYVIIVVAGDGHGSRRVESNGQRSARCEERGRIEETQQGVRGTK